MILAQQPMRVQVQGEQVHLSPGDVVPEFDGYAFVQKATLIRMGMVRVVDDVEVEAAASTASPALPTLPKDASSHEVPLAAAEAKHCPVCNKFFSHAGNLKRHIAKVHGGGA